MQFRCQRGGRRRVPASGRTRALELSYAETDRRTVADCHVQDSRGTVSSMRLQRSSLAPDMQLSNETAQIEASNRQWSSRLLADCMQQPDWRNDMSTTTTISEAEKSNSGKRLKAAGANVKPEASTPPPERVINGKLDLADDVVATIAGLAARQVKGVHALGGARLISFGDNPKRGVGVEIGQREAALDLDIVIEYGCDIHKTVDELRKNIAAVVYQMAGREVVEVNVNVRDIHLPEPESKEKETEKEPETPPRVR